MKTHDSDEEDGEEEVGEKEARTDVIPKENNGDTKEVAVDEA